MDLDAPPIPPITDNVPAFQDTRPARQSRHRHPSYISMGYMHRLSRGYSEIRHAWPPSQPAPGPTPFTPPATTQIGPFSSAGDRSSPGPSTPDPCPADPMHQHPGCDRRQTVHCQWLPVHLSKSETSCRAPPQVSDCVFCFLVNNGVPSHPHADVSNCDVDMTDYRDTFREHITFGAGVCWRCGAAKALGHTGNGFGSFCENKDLQEFIRPLAYIVLNSLGLRQQVFAEMQINPTHFFTHQLDYAQWLGLKSRGIEKWAHHLFEVLYTVAYLFKQGRLSRDNTFELPPRTYDLFSFASGPPHEESSDGVHQRLMLGDGCTGRRAIDTQRKVMPSALIIRSVNFPPPQLRKNHLLQSRLQRPMLSRQVPFQSRLESRGRQTRTVTAALQRLLSSHAALHGAAMSASAPSVSTQQRSVQRSITDSDKPNSPVEATNALRYVHLTPSGAPTHN
jgi:hypothetical protein